jgi:hypothetical protein
MTSELPITPAPRARYGTTSIFVAIAFGVLYAYVLWGAMGNLVELPSSLNSSVPVPWALLVLDVALPFVVFAAALWLGRRRTLPNRVMLFLVGFAVLGCSTVGSIAFVDFRL